MRARTLDECLTAGDTMGRLAAHAARLQKLQHLFAGAVPVSLVSVCRVANFKAGALIVHAENGAAAAKLRQMVPTLIDEFRLKMEEVTEIRIKVQPLDAALQHARPVAPPGLGAAATASFSRLAGTLPDGPLREALYRLLRRDV